MDAMDDHEDDPRAKWRRLPPDPARYTEEVAVGPNASDYSQDRDPDRDTS